MGFGHVLLPRLAFAMPYKFVQVLVTPLMHYRITKFWVIPRTPYNLKQIAMCPTMPCPLPSSLGRTVSGLHRGPMQIYLEARKIFGAQQ